ncbi:MAG: hypothetical protein FJY82_09770 [Candidatus Aminicenantes bacterium]|nr:hypothetical protein [Candidatus Aminicenantes bacterium]
MTVVRDPSREEEQPIPPPKPPPEPSPAEPGAAGPPVEAEGYQVKLEFFEGPLDLLLFLIKKKKIEIRDIPIAVITREYLGYLQSRDRINIDREAEFLLMAALLIYIKSQMLLPREQPLEPDVDPRRELAGRLEDYRRVKVVSARLRDLEQEQSQVWRRAAMTAPLPEDDLDLIEVTLFDLAESFFALMKRKQAQPAKVLKGKDISLADKMKEIVAVLEERGVLDFLDYLEAQETLEEALVAFFCLLELIKARLVIAVQEQLFHTIKVWLRKETSAKDDSP